MTPPCKDCEKKGCGLYHDICPLYQQFKKEREKEYKYRKDYFYPYVRTNKPRKDKSTGLRG